MQLRICDCKLNDGGCFCELKPQETMNTREKMAEMQEQEDSIVKSVVQSYKKRSDVGVKKYNKTMDRDDLSTLEWLQHLQEELMDATLYIEKLKQKL